MPDFLQPDIPLFDDIPAKKPDKADRHKKSDQDKAHEKTASLMQVWTRLPGPGESQHIISDGTFDFFSFVPAFLKHRGNIDHFKGTTWLMNQPISAELIQRYDAGDIGKITLIVGRYLKARTPHVYGFLRNEMRARKQIMKEGRIHAKIIQLRDGDVTLTIEGSANFTENPRTEQYLVTNDRQIYAHHKKWIDDFIW